MTPEQKQQAKQLIADWTNVSKTSTPAVWFLNADCMAGFLQELVDAPATEPVAKVTGYYGGYLSIATIDGRVLPAGTALYLAPPAPPAPSVPDGWRQFLTDVITAAGLLKYGKRDKGLAGRIGKFAFDAMRAATTPAEPPADVARDAERYRWLRTHGLQRAWVSLGTDFEGDNFASFRCEFNLPEPPNLPYEDDEGLPWADKDFDAAIDAAIEREILGGNE